MSYHRSIDGDNDFSRFFFLLNSGPVSVCVLLYGIILIQILIKYNVNVKDLVTACTRLHDSDPTNGKISLPWEGGHPLPYPPPRLVASLRSLAFVLKILSVFFLKSQVKSPPPPHHFWRPVYATAWNCFLLRCVSFCHDCVLVGWLWG